MLLTDSDIITTEDLATIEPQIQQMAANGPILLDDVIRNTWESCTSDLYGQLTSPSGSLYPWQRGQVVGGFGLASVPQRVLLSQVCINSVWSNSRSILKRWMISRGLVEFFTIASQRKASDIYQRKGEQFAVDSRRYWTALLRAGIPIVSQPIYAPGALHIPNSGTWGSSNVLQVTGGSSGAAVSYSVSITFVDTTRTNNNESAGSVPQTISVSAGYVLKMDISSVIPWGTVPAPARYPDGASTPLVPTGWNIYVGTGINGGSQAMYPQNATPIPISQKQYTFSAPPVLGGTVTMAQGQIADALIPLVQVFGRA